MAKPEYKKAVLGKGLPASPGAAVGRVVFTAEEAEKWHKEGEKVGRGMGASRCRSGCAQVHCRLRWSTWLHALSSLGSSGAPA